MKWWEQAVEQEKNPPLLFILTLLSYVYFLGWFLRKSLYSSGVLHPKELPVPVISVGNLTLGGTGKTPTVEALAGLLLEMGVRPAILSRGYKGLVSQGIVSDGRNIRMTAQEAGDEPYLLAKHLPRVPVLIGRDRYASGMTAVRQLGAQVIILDDGFQQRFKLKRTLDLALVDAARVLEKEKLFPRGRLREPLSTLSKVDGFVLCAPSAVKTKGSAKETLTTLLQSINPKAFFWEATHEPISFLSWPDGRNRPVNGFAHKKVIALSSLGNPAGFERTLKSLKVILSEHLRFSDHHAYALSELNEVKSIADNKKIIDVITTEKDMVRFPGQTSLKVWVLKIRMKLDAIRGDRSVAEVLKDVVQGRAIGNEETFKKIMVIRFSSLGDVVLTTPTLRLLRENFQDSEIHLWTKDPFASLFEGHADINKVVPIIKGASLSSLIKKARETDYDLVVDLQGNLKSAVLRYFSGASVKLKYSKIFLKRRLAVWQKLLRFRDSEPVFMRYARTLEKIGVPISRSVVENKGLRVTISRQVQKKAVELLSQYGVKSGDFVVLAPGARWQPKQWPAQSYGEVGRFFAKKYKKRVVVVGSLEEQDLARVVAGKVGEQAVCLAGKTTLPVLAAVLQRAWVTVSNDSGIMHLSLAAGAPTVALFGPTTAAFGFVPWQRHAAVLQRDLFCRPCSIHGSRPCYLGTYECLNSIKPQEVINKALELTSNIK